MPLESHSRTAELLATTAFSGITLMREPNSGAPWPIAGGIFQGLAPQHGRRVRAAGQRRDAAGDAVEMKLLDLAIDALGRLAQRARQKVDRILPNAAGLILAARQDHEFIGHGYVLANSWECPA